MVDSIPILVTTISLQAQLVNLANNYTEVVLIDSSSEVIISYHHLTLTNN